MTAITDLTTHEGLQGATFKWFPFALLLIIGKKKNSLLDSQLPEVSKGHGGLPLLALNKKG